jgi:hypothetical protein
MNASPSNPLRDGASAERELANSATPAPRQGHSRGAGAGRRELAKPSRFFMAPEVHSAFSPPNGVAPICLSGLATDMAACPRRPVKPV